MSSNKIDIKAVQDIVSLSSNGDISHLKELIKIYSDDNLLRIDRMEKFFAEKKFVELGKEAHAMKSGSQALGANFLAEICELIEYREIRNVSEGELSTYVKEVRPLFEEACAELFVLYAQMSARAA